MGWVKDIALKEAIFFERLPCGMPVYIFAKAGFRQKHAIWHIGFGSLHQALPHKKHEASKAIPAGVAHFLEHRLFQKESGDISELFSQLGAEVNAYTTYTHTAFFFPPISNSPLIWNY
jgi:hypothetical protein